MSVSKKFNEKTVKGSNKRPSKKLIYSFLLLIIANAILLLFLAFFTYRLYDSQVSTLRNKEIAVVPIPRLLKQEDLTTSALSFVVYDPASRSLVLSKNQNMRLSPASSIKILTALVAIENYDLNDYLTVSVVASFDESKMGLKLGEKIKVRDLLYGLLLASGNDAAKTLAINYPGGASAFVTAMNTKAKELGLSNSNFLDPSGYEDNNYSSAFELARLASFAMRNPTIRDIVGTKEITVYDANNYFVHPLKNLNELLLLNNVTGVKTGFTNEAGGVLITSYVHLGRELIIVVMKSEDRFADTRRIIEEIKNNVYYSNVSDEVTRVSSTAGT